MGLGIWYHFILPLSTWFDEYPELFVIMEDCIWGSDYGLVYGTGIWTPFSPAERAKKLKLHREDHGLSVHQKLAHRFSSCCGQKRGSAMRSLFFGTRNGNLNPFFTRQAGEKTQASPRDHGFSIHRKLAYGFSSCYGQKRGSAMRSLFFGTRNGNRTHN